MPEPRDHMQKRGWIETILRYIPGFRGYLEKDYRREADALQRKWLADELGVAKRKLDVFAQDLTAAVKLDPLNQTERVRDRIDRMIGRINGATQGYSGFFDYAQVDEALLDQVYEQDVAMMTRVESLVDGVDSLQANGDDAAIAAGLVAVLGTLDELSEAWDKREHVLQGIG